MSVSPRSWWRSCGGLGDAIEAPPFAGSGSGPGLRSSWGHRHRPYSESLDHVLGEARPELTWQANGSRSGHTAKRLRGRLAGEVPGRRRHPAAATPDERERGVGDIFKALADDTR